MANLIRLKQIEGSTSLQAAISAGNAISQSGGSFTDAVNNTVSSSLSGALSLISTDFEASAISASIAATDSSISSSISTLSSSINTKIIGLTASYDSRYVLSGSITQTTWDNIANKPSGIISGSSQIIGILDSLNQFTSSLDDGFATDYEVYVTTSNIIDQGEW